jgi:hypothetical protein
MKKLLLATFAVLGLGVGMSAAFAAPAPAHYNHPNVVHAGPAYGDDAGPGA